MDEVEIVTEVIVTGVKGLGKIQRKERGKTDKKIYAFIRDNPGSYTRQIIKKSGIKSATTVENSLKRLYNDNKIRKVEESEFFKKIKIRKWIPKNSVGYVINYQNSDEEHKEFNKCQKKIL